MKRPSPAANPIRVLIADSSPLQLQLLSSALRRRPEFTASTCPLDSDLILKELEQSAIQVLLLDINNQSSSWLDMGLLRRIHIAFPNIPKVLLLEEFNRELAVNAFRFLVPCDVRIFGTAEAADARSWIASD